MSIEIKGLINGVIAAVVALALVFGLAAVLKPKTSNAPPVKQNAAAGSNGVGASATLVLQGHGVYTQYCAGCHGDQGQGVMGPDVRNEDMTDDQITKLINNGAGRMPAFKTKLSKDQISSVVAFVRTMKK